MLGPWKPVDFRGHRTMPVTVYIYINAAENRESTYVPTWNDVTIAAFKGFIIYMRTVTEIRFFKYISTFIDYLQ